MARSQMDLMPGEKMVLHSHPHWWFFWKQAAGGVGVLVLLLLFAWVSNNLLSTAVKFIFLIALVVWAANTVYQFIQWRSTQFAVTDQRVAFQSGVIRRHGVSIPLNRINNVNFDQSMIARMLNNGIVIVESAGETGDSVFENIPDPEHVRSVIFAQVEVDENSDSERSAAALAKILDSKGNTTSTGHTAQQRLKELEELRDQGLVSDSEFEIKRKQILEDL